MAILNIRIMAKAKDLLKSLYFLRKGSVYQPIVKQVTQGKINPRATYIQTFDRMVFNLVDPDVVFITTADKTCYLYKVD